MNYSLFTSWQYIVAIITIVTIGITIYSFDILNTENSSGIYHVTKQTLERTARFSGTAEPMRDVNLSFDTSGRVKRVLVDEGDKVKTGDLLTELENDSVRAELTEAQANRRAQEIELAKLVAGSRYQEIEQQRAAVNAAEATVNERRGDVYEDIEASFQIARDAVEGPGDTYFINVDTQPIFTIQSSEGLGIENSRASIGDMLRDWGVEIRKGKYSEEGRLSEYTDRILPRLKQIRDHMGQVLNIVNDKQASISTAEREAVFTAWQNVKDIHDDIKQKTNQLQEARATLSEQQEALSLAQEGTRAEDIAIQRAEVDKADAQIQRLRAEIEKTQITAPFDGVILRSDIDPGETADSTDQPITLAQNDRLEIVGDVSELDVPGIRVGATTTVTFDALGENTPFAARVVEIDETETIIDNVPTYEVTLTPLGVLPNVRPGMSATISLITTRRENVVAIPENGLKTRTRSSGTVIQVSKNGEKIEVPVTLGITGDNGLIEIRSGLKAGHRIISTPSYDS